MRRPATIPRVEGILLGRTAEERAIERGIAWERRDAWRECMRLLSSIVIAPIDAGVRAALGVEVPWLNAVTLKGPGTVRLTPKPPPMRRPSEEPE